MPLSQPPSHPSASTPLVLTPDLMTSEERDGRVLYHSHGPSVLARTSSEVWLGEFLRLEITRYQGEAASVKKRRLVEGGAQNTNIIAS